jgi:hypothetical protein
MRVQAGSRFQTWLMPLWAALTAALGSYLGVIRAISEVREEVRVVKADYHATVRAIDRRLERIEDGEVRAGNLVDRHERIFHHERRAE